MERISRGDDSAAAEPAGTTETDAASGDYGDDWVHELIAMTRPGVEINVQSRGLREHSWNA
ncbi:hypothetical protein [Novosphingopyxis sp.]|uniref:hypothetical protein n=1 Tax=Novosphingopyxis sp. TaxID=2709690 RepID=UPI003B5C12B1